MAKNTQPKSFSPNRYKDTSESIAVEIIAGMLANLKEKSAARKALEAGHTIEGAFTLLDKAFNLLVERLYSDNITAAYQLALTAKKFTEDIRNESH